MRLALLLLCMAPLLVCSAPLRSLARKAASLLLAASLPLSLPAIAADAISPKTTAKVFLDVMIGSGKGLRDDGTKRTQTLEIALYGDEAPQSSKFFAALCMGQYIPEESTRKLPNGDDIIVSYDGSQVSRIVKDKRIDVGKFALGSNQRQTTTRDSVGKVRISNINLASNVIHSDKNDLRHDSIGIVSVPKAGQTFEFTIAPSPNAELDSDHIVIGRVIEGIDVVEKINAVPTSREDGTKQLFINAGKSFDGRAKIAAVGRPLQKITITRCSVDGGSGASMASFLKF